MNPPEFSRPRSVASLSPGETVAGEADAAERAALTKRYGVRDVRALSFTATATPWGSGGWRVEGVVEAALTQTCVVTLEPVDTELREPFARHLVPRARLEEAAELLDPELDDDPEPLGETIDVGEMAAESAALAIDPYPRAPGVAFEGRLQGPLGVEPLTDEEARPFARLAALRRSGGDA